MVFTALLFLLVVTVCTIMSLCGQYRRCVDVLFIAASSLVCVLARVCVRVYGHQCGRVTLTEKKKKISPSSLAWRCGLNFDELEIF